MPTATRPSLFKTLKLPLGLMLLGILPIAASAFRVVVMSDPDAHNTATPDEARFLAMPVSILSHVIFGSLFLIIGALQMSSTLRMRHRKLHRKLGYAALIAGLTFAISGVWMVFFYPSHSLGALHIDIGRVIFGTAITVVLSLGIRSALRKDFAQHRAWMIRAYALSASAGVQSYLILLALAINGSFDAKLADIMMWVGWITSAVAAEFIITRPSNRKPQTA